MTGRTGSWYGGGEGGGGGGGAQVNTCRGEIKSRVPQCVHLFDARGCKVFFMTSHSRGYKVFFLTLTHAAAVANMG